MSYIILTGSAAESSRLQKDRWVPSANLVPVTLLHRGVLDGLAGHGDVDLFYTDNALDALVESAARPAPSEGASIFAAADTAWNRWRRARHLYRSVRPLEAWEWLNEASLEELEDRNRAGMAIISSASVIPAQAPSLSYLDLISFERRHCAAAVRAKAADHLVRIASGRIHVTEEQAVGQLIVRATWTALPAADRVAPSWLVEGLDNASALAGA